MNIKFIVFLIFIFSSISTILFILFKPNITLNSKYNIKIQTFYFGVLIGAILIIIIKILSFEEIKTNLIGSSRLSPIGILILFLSMAFISIFLDYCGFFDYCARIAIKHSEENSIKLFFVLYFIVSTLTIFTSNDIVILTFTPFIYYFARDTKIDPIPFLVAEFFAANTWSMMLYIGNPTNILIAGASGISFFSYFLIMALPTIVAGLTNLFVVYAIFYKHINYPIIKQDIDPKAAIKDKQGSLIGLIVLVLCIITLSISQYIHISIWKISLFFAFLLATFITIRVIYNLIKAIKNKTKFSNPILTHTVEKMPWGVIPFVLSLFIIVEALQKYGITEDISLFLNSLCMNNQKLYIFIYGILSTLSANFLNNIPMSLSFVPLISSTPKEFTLGTAYSVIIGSNLGANVTPIGALAGIMWMSILKNHGFKISFLKFIQYGLPVTFFSLLASLFTLSLFF